MKKPTFFKTNTSNYRLIKVVTKEIKCANNFRRAKFEIETLNNDQV